MAIFHNAKSLAAPTNQKQFEIQCRDEADPDEQVRLTAQPHIYSTKIQGLNGIRRGLSNANVDGWMSDLQGELIIPGLSIEIAFSIPATAQSGGHDISTSGKMIGISDNNVRVNFEFAYIQSLKRLVVKNLRFEPPIELFFDADITGETFTFLEDCLRENVQGAYGNFEEFLKKEIARHLTAAVKQSS